MEKGWGYGGWLREGEGRCGEGLNFGRRVKNSQQGMQHPLPSPRLVEDGSEGWEGKEALGDYTTTWIYFYWSIFGYFLDFCGDIVYMKFFLVSFIQSVF